MNAKAILLTIALLGLVMAVWAALAGADSIVSGIHIGTTQGIQGSSSHISGAVGGGQASAEAVISGQNGVIVIQGDRVEIEGGRLSLNGIPHGTVGPQSVVRFTVNGGVKRLLVDGVERGPEVWP